MPRKREIKIEFGSCLQESHLFKGKKECNGMTMWRVSGAHTWQVAAGTVSGR